ncbi:AraC family transcriptional regulator [Pseudoxanthomonas sp. JBR18]|uniref:AraC family transcriptional regulator n=1 Tax=Pseudoxanthomonas sp. JBR18 TaxID=2969308 RepID=UPI002304FCD5|nr:AraC family transcriptional regulator [Pseudoxanthomonas sp. JBR18]WCE05654.1 AraC family transcriptional regulator [Pseudoxanthomonas sp. JBR18]
MSPSLLDLARRHAEAFTDPDGVAPTPIPGLTIIRQTRPTALQYAISKPLVALILQGEKRVSLGCQTLEFGAGQSLLIAADVPNASQVTRADLLQPYVSLVIDLDPAIIEGLVVEMDGPSHPAPGPMRVDPTEQEVAGTALRLLGLLDRPASLALLQAALLRELHYWLLVGRHGQAIRMLGLADSHARRVARAVNIIRADYARPLRIEHLAQVADMSPSSFHAHFRAVTTLTPLQFQKQVRLIEARRLMLAEGAMIAQAANAVGYESIQQFTREYGRMFGLPPARDMRQARSRLQPAA